MTYTPATQPRYEVDRCANCFEALPDDYAHRPWLFCDVLCRETANTIRYWRKTSRNGKFASDPEVRAAIGIRLAHMLAGGYDSDARRIPLDVRAHVIDRDKACVQCGGPGEEIDHINGDSSHPGNLQLLCRTCHHAKTAKHLVPASPDQSTIIFGLLVGRVVPDVPAQLCDDEIDWVTAERRLRSARIARVRPAKVRRKDELTSIEILSPVRVPVVFDDASHDDDDEDRRKDDYAGFGENSHYIS